MKINNKSLFLVVLLFILVVSISSISAVDIDEATDVDLLNSNDDVISVENSNEVESLLSTENDVDNDVLKYAESTSDAYIKFDQEDITITEGDSFTVTGSLVDSNGNNPGGDDFPVSISSNGKTELKDLSGHRLSYTFDNSWNFVASASPYIIEFTPEDGGEYVVNYLESGAPEMSKSWIKLTVNSKLPEPKAVYNGVVSGDVEVVTVNPWSTSGELKYDIPANAKDIKNAIIYINVYAGSGSNPNYALDLKSTIKTNNGERDLGYEVLWTEECSMDGTVYTISGNNHVNRVYSDYQVMYNVTEIVNGLNGTSLSVNVNSIQKSGYQFDGRIKLIGLLLAYDDGDDDIINYWVDSNQYYATTDLINIEMDTLSLKVIDNAIWSNIVLSSTDAGYKINNQIVGDADKHSSGSYYQFNQWNVTESISPSSKTTLTYSNNGYSIKPVLAILKVETHQLPTANINSITPEYSGIAYPGTINALTIKVTPSKSGKYTIRLLADGNVVNTTEVELEQSANNIVVVDPTIRAIDETTVAGINNKNVIWTVEILSDDNVIATKDLNAKILYNGYFGSEYAYGIEGYKAFMNVSFTGDIVVDIKPSSTYADAGNKARTDVWTVDLDENSNIVGGFIIVPYNWFNYNNGNNIEDINMIEAIFNEEKLNAVGFVHDNPNLGWNYGYGALIYDVSQLINSNGDNSLVLNRLVGNPALNPSIFVYYYNTTGSSTIKNMYMVNGYDLLYNSNNKADRLIQSKSTIDINTSKINNATVYVFATCADPNDGYIIVNGEKYENCWNGNTKSSDLFKADITNIAKDSNEVIFVATSSTITALPQFIVTSADLVKATASVKAKDNSKNVIYPSFNNTLTVTINTNKAGKYTVNLLIGENIVNSTNFDLVVGDNTIELVDPTIREVSEANKYVTNLETEKVNYNVEIVFEDEIVGHQEYEGIILYNGYLGKDTHNEKSLESFYNGTITGDIVIITNGTYATALINRMANFTVEIAENSSIVKAFMYVSYCYGSGGKDNIDMFNVTFNGNKLSPIYFARDQSNIAANSGYGLIVYEVTDFIVEGNNILDLNKTISAGLYPSTLIYMYNTTGSEFVKNIYISNGADLIGTYGGRSNEISVNSIIDVNASDVINATAYIFANGAQDGRASVIINDESENHPWNGSSQSTDMYVKDITGSVKESNLISVVYSGTNAGSLTALQQIIVLTKKTNVVKSDDSKNNTNAGVNSSKTTPNNVVANDKKVTKKATKITAKKKTFKAKTKIKKYTITLKSGKTPIKKVRVYLKIGKKTYKAVTNKKGKATFKIKKLSKKGKYKAVIKFKGNSLYKASSKTVKYIKIKK